MRKTWHGGVTVAGRDQGTAEALPMVVIEHQRGHPTRGARTEPRSTDGRRYGIRIFCLTRVTNAKPEAANPTGSP